MSHECLICFDQIEQEQDKVSCLVCKKIVHYNCFHTWSKKKKNNKDLAICVHCQQPALMIHRHYTTCCCFRFYKTSI